MGSESRGDAHHWTPDLLVNVTRALTKLCRAQENVLDFLQGSGVDRALLAPWRSRLAVDRKSVRKKDIAEAVLRQINDGGDRTLAQRREVIRRIVQFENFDQCWDDDRTEAKALVAEIRNLVELKDSVTILQQQIRAEAARKAEENEAASRLRARRRAEVDSVKSDLFSLFGEANVWTRGKDLERVLNRLFKAYDIHVRDPFAIVHEDGHPVEQIDGVILLGGHYYLVEVKWEKEPIGVQPVGYRISRLMVRPDVRGIFINASGFTGPAVDACREALPHRLLFLCELEEITSLLEYQHDLTRLLQRKVEAASVDRNPFVRIVSMPTQGP
ncbi:MAG: restriction endonuclease [Deltaproteobacteria bacterium]|nr:restriction endonuclease [Deltaproteobacteria bacterium]